jgi:hypothetical protein
MNQVELRFFPKSRWVALRELNGFDEQSISGTDTLAAIGLLDRLLMENPAHPLGPEEAAGLTAPDRDRLLAAIYARTFGSRIASTTHCGQCGQLFDLDFSLDQLLSRLEFKPHPAIERRPDATFRLPDGCVFRLPTGLDECAVAGLPLPEAEATLWARCVLEPGTHCEAWALWQACEEIGPGLNLDLDAVCPECSHVQSVHFDIQTYLLTTLRQEQNTLIRDIHRLATAYGWSLHEILELTRSERHTLVNLIDAEVR